MTPSAIIFAIIFFFCLWRHYMEPGCPMFYGKLRLYSIAMWASFILFILSARVNNTNAVRPIWFDSGVEPEDSWRNQHPKTPE